MRKRTLFCNGRIHTQAHGQIVDSLAVNGRRIVAVGNRLEYDPDLKQYSRYDLKGKTLIPGFVDAHTHFHFFATQFGQVDLDGVDSLDLCLKKIKAHAAKLPNDQWVIGAGYAPDRFKKRIEPDRYLLDKITGGRPAFLFSKDQHSAWVNSRALKMADIDAETPDPDGGEIVRFDDGTPSGILRERPAYLRVWDCTGTLRRSLVDKLWQQALEYAWRRGVTGVHSFDGKDALAYMHERASRGKLGLRVNYYPHCSLLDDVERERLFYGTGDDFFRIAGIKVFADGALGSQTALCFNKYIGSRDNFGIEVTSSTDMSRIIKRAAKLGLPCAIHGIGDKAISNILDAMSEKWQFDFGARHRIEHVQLVRRTDIKRMRAMNVTASVQPSHCPSDIDMIRTYWGSRGRNAYIFRSMIDAGLDLALGSDCPIEPLDPLAGIAAAVRRARKGKRDAFHPEQRLTAAEALFGFTAGPAIAAGQAHTRGFLLPGYPADLVVLADDPTRVAPSRIYDMPVLATILDGRVCFADTTLKL